MLGKQADQKGKNSKAWAAQQKLTIAIDGPAGAGKSTVARLAAQELGYAYIDTGAMYRAATLLVLRAKVGLDHQKAIAELIRNSTIELLPTKTECQGKVRVVLNKEDVSEEIRGQAVTNAVGAVSAVVPVRELLVEKQRQLASLGGVIVDGRDIGTVVLPNADLKIFLTASPEVRARRRYEELLSLEQVVDYDTLLAEIIERDRKDSNRATAPLKQAQDAIAIITDNLSIPQVVDTIIRLCDPKDAND